jgi:tetratricopeptide (TPR) repeat protein
MRKNLIYPWLSVWFKPRDTISYMLQYGSWWSIVLLTLLVLWINMSYVELITFLENPGYVVSLFVSLLVLLVDILLLYMFGKLLKGKASKKEIFFVIILSAMPLFIFVLYDLFPTSSTLSALIQIFTIWSIVLSIVMLAEVEKFSKWKAALSFFLYYIAFFAPLLYLNKGNVDTSKMDVNSSIAFLQYEMENNESAEHLALLAEVGYENYYDNIKDFAQYNDEILGLFYKGGWQAKTMATQAKLWMNIASQESLNEDDFETFIEQLETLDSIEVDENSTWGKLSKQLPQVYLKLMDSQLERVASSQVDVPLVTLYSKEGKRLEEMQASRDYLVSNVYVLMADFCDEAQNSLCAADEYAKKAVETSDLNPSALFFYAYLLDDDTKSIALLESVLPLVAESEDLLNYDLDAVYNNLGYAIYTDKQEKKYDDALIYLKKAYALNKSSVYSLATMSAIYNERKEYQAMYDVLENETYSFFKSDDNTLADKEKNYWTIVKQIISVSYDFNDFNTTKYACEKLLAFHDDNYTPCFEKTEAIKQKELNVSIVPSHSFWPLYSHPEFYEKRLKKRLEKESKETKTLSCGTLQTYGESLKSKMTSRKQTKLLEKFTKLYAPYTVPDTLKKLIVFEEQYGADNYVTSFFLDPEEKKEFFYYAFSGDAAVNAKVADSFLPLANIDGTGGSIAFWVHDRNNTDLENAPIVALGSEGHIGLVAKNLKDLLFMMSLGVEGMDGEYSQYDSSEEYYRRPGFMAYREWLKETMHIEPLKEWKIWGTPKKIETLHDEVVSLYKEKFFAWLYRYIPDPKEVQKKYDAEQFAKLSKEKIRLEKILDNNVTVKVYCDLAENARRLRYVDKAEFEDEKAFYLKALRLDENNVTVLFKLAKLSSHEEALAYYKTIEHVAKDLKEIPVYYKMAVTYGYLKEDNSSLKYYKKHIALDPRPNNYGDSATVKLSQKMNINPIDVYEEAVKIAPNQLNFETLYDLYLEKRDYASAMLSLERLFKVKTLKDFEYSVWGGDFFDKGKNAYALKVFEEGTKKLKDFNDIAYLHKKMAEVYENEKNRSKTKEQKALAIASYKLAIEAENEEENNVSKKVKFFIKIADVYEEQKEYMHAITYLKKAAFETKDMKERSEYLYYIADHYLSLGLLDQSLKYAEDSLSLMPKDKASLRQIKEIKKRQNILSMLK